jgi:hypothetical protein
MSSQNRTLSAFPPVMTEQLLSGDEWLGMRAEAGGFAHAAGSLDQAPDHLEIR